MKADNFENDLYHATNNTGIGNSDLLSCYLYTNIDNTQKHSIIKLVLAITNHKNKSNNNNTNFPILTYQKNRCITSLNE